MRFVALPSLFHELELARYLASEPLNARERLRFTAVLLSSRKTPLQEIAGILGVSANSVEQWFSKYDSAGLPGLLDGDMAHKKSALSSEDENVVLSCVGLSPQNLAGAVAKLEADHGIKTNVSALRRFIKKKKYTWRRVRKSLKSQRKPGDFDFCEEEIRALLTREAKGEIELWFTDEAAFGLNPVSHYAWQTPGDGLVLPAERKKVASILGFIRRDNSAVFYDFAGNMTADLWMALTDDFISKRPSGKQIVIVADNASTHKAKITGEKIPVWESKNVFIQYLKPYCSELNPIETVWRFVKHKWLCVADYLSPETLKKAVENILNKFGTDYRIKFKEHSGTILIN